MSPGHFSGQLRCLGLDGVEVYEERLNTRVEQFFRAPSGSLAFCFDQSENSLYLLNEQSRNIWITPENYQEVAVVFDHAFSPAMAWTRNASKGCSWCRWAVGRMRCSAVG